MLPSQTKSFTVPSLPSGLYATHSATPSTWSLCHAQCHPFHLVSMPRTVPPFPFGFYATHSATPSIWSLCHWELKHLKHGVNVQPVICDVYSTYSITGPDILPYIGEYNIHRNNLFIKNLVFVERLLTLGFYKRNLHEYYSVGKQVLFV